MPRRRGRTQARGPPMSAFESLDVRAGPRALAHVRERPVAPSDVTCIPAAAGGPKGLALLPFDRRLLDAGYAARDVSPRRRLDRRVADDRAREPRRAGGDRPAAQGVRARAELPRAPTPAGGERGDPRRRARAARRPPAARARGRRIGGAHVPRARPARRPRRARPRSRAPRSTTRSRARGSRSTCDRVVFVAGAALAPHPFDAFGCCACRSTPQRRGRAARVGLDPARLRAGARRRRRAARRLLGRRADRLPPAAAVREPRRARALPALRAVRDAWMARQVPAMAQVAPRATTGSPTCW